MLNEALSQYVDLHCSVGFKFRVQRLLLANFVRFAERHGDEFIRVARVIEWAVQAPSPPQRRNRLLAARRFGLSLQAEDPRHEVPAPDAIGRGLFKRRTPYIYTPREVAALMKAAAGLRPSGSIRPLMYSTLFGLIAATGMRISEALALRIEDATDEGLFVRETKFHKSRLLPLHDTTRRALDSYLSMRRRLGTLDGALFVSNTLAAPAYPTVVATFLRPDRSAYEVRLVSGAPGSTTSGTALPCGPWNPVVPIGRLSPATSSHSAPISAMATSPIRTGISKPRRS
jgi:integrase